MVTDMGVSLTREHFGVMRNDRFKVPVVVVDPGGTSGVLLAGGGTGALWEISSEPLIGYVKQGIAIASMVIGHDWGENVGELDGLARVVIEDFILTGPGRGGWSSGRDGLAPHAIIHAMLSCLYERDWTGEIWLQQPGQKDVINNGRLKMLGYEPDAVVFPDHKKKRAMSDHLKDVCRHHEVWVRDQGKRAAIVL